MSILTQDQKNFLNAFSKESLLTNTFYLTGGTALAEFYIPYRYSDDLDFFSENEVNTQGIYSILKKYKQELGFTEIDYNTSFNRNLFFLKFPKYVLKTEFTYFPFPQIEKQRPINGVVVDSALDITVNKLFTIYQNPRTRDFIDFYMLQRAYSYRLEELVNKARAKFDWHVDYIKLGSQFLLCTEVKDYPNIIEPIEDSLWQEYFIDEAKRLKSNIFE